MKTHNRTMAEFMTIPRFQHVLLLCVFLYQTSSVCEAQKLVAQAADLLSPIHSSIQHGIQSQNDTTKGGDTLEHPALESSTQTCSPHMLRMWF